MYIVTEKSADPFDLDLFPTENTWACDWSQAEVRSALEPRNFRGIIDDIGAIARNNERMRRAISEKDVGKPGHYYGRDIMIEGSMPASHFALAPMEYGNDPDWFKDDVKFQDFMKRNPVYSYLS